MLLVLGCQAQAGLRASAQALPCAVGGRAGAAPTGHACRAHAPVRPRARAAAALCPPRRLAADASGVAPKELTQEIVRLKGGAAAQKEAALLALCSKAFQVRAHACVDGIAGCGQSHGTGMGRGRPSSYRGAPELCPTCPLPPLLHPAGRAHHHFFAHQAARAPPENAVWPGGAAACGRAARRHDAGGAPGEPGALSQGGCWLAGWLGRRGVLAG